jgi:hypothetical protein
MKVRVTVKNPFPVKGYCVRGILMHNQLGWDISDAEGYTSLFDDGGEVVINPFTTFSSEIEPYGSTYRVKWIVFPDNPDFNGVSIIVEASWPGYCEDVFELKRDEQPIAVHYGGSNAKAVVYPEDFQHDIVSITMDATEIGAGIVEFEQDPYWEDDWFAEFFAQGASGGAEPGEYRLLVTALSNSPIPTYTYVNFFLNPLPPPYDVTPGNLDFGVQTIVVWDNNRLITGRRLFGIDIFDAHIPDRPTWAGSVQLQDEWDPTAWLTDIAVEGNLVFVPSFIHGVYVVDVSYIYSPKLQGIIEIGHPLRVATGEGYVYTGRADETEPGPGSIVIIDPYASPFPEIVGELVTETFPWDLTVHNGFLYFNAGFKFFVANLANPTDPVIIKEIQLPHGSFLFDLTAVGDFLFGRFEYTGFDDLLALDISNPYNPVVAGSLEIPYGFDNLSIIDGYAFLDAANRIYTVDIDPPDEMELVGQVEPLGWINDIAAGTHHIYTVEEGPHSLTVYNPDPPVEPFPVKRLSRLYKPREFVPDGRYAYLLDQYSFKVLDIDPPERSCIINSIKLSEESPTPMMGIAIDGDVACVIKELGIWQPKLFIISLYDPENPVVLVSIDVSGSLLKMDLYADNGYAYFATNENIIVADIDPPEESYIAAELDTPFPIRLCALKNNRLYCYSEEYGLQVLDVTVPTNPQLLGGMPYFGDLRGFVVRKNYAYAGGIDSIMVIYIGDPQAMEIVAEAHVPFEPKELFLMGGFLFAAAGDDGVWIANIFPHGTINPVFNLEMPPLHHYTTDVACQGGYMYVTTESYDADSLRIYKWW